MKILILFSGGLDSIGLTIYALECGYDVHLLHLSYVHPAQQLERECSENAAEKLSERYPNSITYSAVEHGIIADEMFQTGTRYVPMRNLSFLGVAANWAVAYDCKEIWIGATNLDQQDYADCRPEFLGLFQIICQQQLYDIHIISPYLEDNATLKTRSAVKSYCKDLHIKWSSCYEPIDGSSCNNCNSCLQ